MHKKLGCHYTSSGAEFRVFAPEVSTVELYLLETKQRVLLSQEDALYWSVSLDSFAPGALYQFFVNGQGPFPDPVSRCQPQGVHGPSQGVDFRLWSFQNQSPQGVAPARRSIYELHVGTFTPQGTFQAAQERLAVLKELGVTCIEIMPIGDFPGNRNWGYDGVSIFAPARCYGTPQEFAQLVDHAHGLGIMVLLDVVYNHFGPDGNYTGVYSQYYLNDKHHTPWGAALNYDGDYSEGVREFFNQNALQWIQDYHLDGLRLDATHSICDDSDVHFLSQLRGYIQAQVPKREFLLYAEDHRNPNNFAMPSTQGGFGLDGVWADDLHHHLRRHTAGDHEGYFAPFDGSMNHIAQTLEQGWFRDGSASEGIRSQGSDPQKLLYSAFVVCIQNHDQVGNRALGDRIHHQVESNVYKALSTLLLFSPETPLLFMGQEWACQTPFQFFTHHHDALGKLVTAGRRKEFQDFKDFADPSKRESIPDPQSESTFLHSVLNWGELEISEHQEIWNLYRDLLHLRATHPALGSEQRADFSVKAVGAHGLWLSRQHQGHSLVALVWLSNDPGEISFSQNEPSERWRVALKTNPTIHLHQAASQVVHAKFPTAGALIITMNVEDSI